MPYGLVDSSSLTMQPTPLGVLFRGELQSFQGASSGGFYTDWIASSRPSPRTSSAFNLGNNPATVNMFEGVVCPAGFFTQADPIADSYTLPLLLDVPMNALDTADHVEVRLSEEKRWSRDGITLSTKRGDNTTRKTVEWKVPEDGSK
jgi:hypothetical protein